ncbi:IS5 family transposase [Frankia canadensis]|uniref:IS5 family transposase n=1 Tax=Frankia canadensis TaxID=1836972 RepID=UPI003C2B4DDC
MRDEVLTEQLWERLAPLIPVRQRSFRYPGRLPVDDRAALEGILWVLRNDVAWRQLPTTLFGVSGVTCWRRLRDWQAAGVWQRLHEQMLAECNAAGRLDLHRALVDSSHVHALKRGAQTGPSPVNRAHPGSKHHVITDATGVPLATTLTGGNRNDVTQLIPLVEAIPLIRGRRGRPRHRPRYLLADRAYDHDIYRRKLTARQITPIIARRGTPHGSGLGTQRWPVERTIGWLHQFRRLRTRWERRADIHQAFLSLACSIICLRKLKGSF